MPQRKKQKKTTQIHVKPCYHTEIMLRAHRGTSSSHHPSCTGFSMPQATCSYHIYTRSIQQTHTSTPTARATLLNEDVTHAEASCDIEQGGIPVHKHLPRPQSVDIILAYAQIMAVTRKQAQETRAQPDVSVWHSCTR